MPARPAFHGLDFVDGGPTRRVGGTRKRVNEVYVNNEGEEMNTLEEVGKGGYAARAPLMAGATPVAGTSRK